jgi:Ser/Thr protein kinase RdoA (MazF antagonist)
VVETLPGFHDPKRRLDQLRAVVADDPCGRLAGCRDDVGLAFAGIELAELADDLTASTPVRVAHNDAKLDNVLFRDGDAVAIVDLDTLMAGRWFWDVGDLLRSAAATTGEDDPALEDIAVDESRYRAVLAGYRRGVGNAATRAEFDATEAAGALVTYEQALRFLADWLAGDVYYRTSRAGQNLDRARNQLRLLACMPHSPL